MFYMFRYTVIYKRRYSQDIGKLSFRAWTKEHAIKIFKHLMKDKNNYIIIYVVKGGVI